MPQSLAKILVHIIFSTKERRPCLSAEFRPRLYAYMSGILEQWDCKAVHIGGVADHVHVLGSLSRTHAPCKIVEELKKGSSLWIKTQGTSLDYEKFHWQNGYGMFSIGQSQVPSVLQYIAGQEEHHNRVTFQEEYRDFLRRYGIEWDERYVWD